MNADKVYQMSFGKVYPLLVNKVLRKGGKQEDVNQLIGWLTGYSADEITSICLSYTYEQLFEHAPNMNENRHHIKGSICGIKIQEIEEPLMKEIRYLDKLIDDLAKGKSVDQIIQKLEN